MSLKCKYVSLATSAILLIGSVARADIRSTIQNAASGTTVQCSGTYSVSGKITVPSGVTVAGPATFNFTSSTSDGFAVASSGSGVTLKSLTVSGANHGFMILGSGCKITSCIASANHNSGFEISAKAAQNNVLSGCTSYNNADSSGGNADGYSAKNGTGAGNQFVNCTAYQNSDDGFDFYGADSPIAVSGCLCYSMGSAQGKTGNGDGFKMGAAESPANNVLHSYTSCTSHNNTAGNSARGFNSNGNTAAMTLTTCHSYSNRQVDRVANCKLVNCTMQQ
ncbi:MAG TPA: right-handed parallel beta-helix repeat-containing protein [Verrucomicrobiae bacterium]|nr:right-handed parallel beta-helix repeat-containing protein [Verrucomicrobiae bacterium]